ncbi:MAG: aminoacyl-histidine dipeptidase [Bacteroidales bacterium]
MSKVLSGLKPQAVWEFFEEICNIPHPSKHEEKMIEYTKDFAAKHGLESEVDETGNVIIRKPATAGMEDRQTIVLQGHLDMVPQKNSDKQHDFTKDPIEPVIDGDWVKANGTTLGADNGIGVAASLAILQDKTIEHGPIEALFTVDEETGMGGAFGLKKGFIKGDILLNLDSEDEGELYIGCAGGVDTNISFKYSEENTPSGHIAYKIVVKGLKGGHSGLDINTGRGNANKIINRVLWQANRELGLQLASIDGGSLKNAIPREAEAVVTLPKENAQKLEELVSKTEAEAKNELGSIDPGLSLKAEKIDNPSKIIAPKVAKNFFDAVYGCPHGVIRMIGDMPEIVETSTNLAILKSENNNIEVSTLQRSSVDSAKDDLANMIRSVFELAGADVEHEGAYPGWKPNVNSPILKTMKEVYNNKFGKVPEQKVIHAGLECGLIGGVQPNLDMISFGPDIENPHSPDERVNVKSVELFWQFLLETLKNVPKK